MRRQGGATLGFTSEELDRKSEMQSDTLSAVLRAVHLTGSMFFRVRLSPPYAITA